MSDAQRPGPEEMMRELARMRTEAEETVAAYDRLSAEFGSDAVEAVSEDGLIRVRLDPQGKVAEIAVSEAAMRHRQTLGPAMVAVIAQARGEYAARTAEMARRLLAGRVDVDALIARYRPPDQR